MIHDAAALVNAPQARPTEPRAVWREARPPKSLRLKTSAIPPKAVLSRSPDCIYLTA